MKNYLPDDSPQKRLGYDLNLEGLRGLLALLVGFSHVFGITYILDPAYHPDLYWMNVGQSAVLVFFILSGYVIGLTNQGRYTHSKAVDYLVRRGVRLIPIYILAIFLGWLAYPKITANELLGNFFFLQNILVPRIEGNSPVWSLNYELIYYLIFLLIWWLRPQFTLLFGFCITLSIVGWLNPQIPSFLQGYSSGFIFWLFGLWLAWKTELDSNSPKVPLLSLLFLFFALHHFNIGKVILDGIGLASSSPAKVALADLISVFAICSVLVAVITRRNFDELKWFKIVCFTLPLLLILFLLAKGRLLEPRWLPAATFYLLAVGCWAIKFNLDRLAALAISGQISYGFYLVHFPLLLLTRQYFPFSGSLITFCLRLVVWFSLSVTVAILLELFLQPLLKRWLYDRFKVTKPAV